MPVRPDSIQSSIPSLGGQRPQQGGTSRMATPDGGPLHSDQALNQAMTQLDRHLSSGQMNPNAPRGTYLNIVV